MMTALRRFDPVAFAAACRKNRLGPLRVDDLPRFGEQGYWRAGTQQLLKVILGWWVGEVNLFSETLESAVSWLDAPEDMGRPWGENWKSHDARHRHARALAHLIIGDDRTDLWTAAAEAYAVALEEAGPVGMEQLAPSAALCSAMARIDARLQTDIELSDDLAESIVDILSCVTDPVSTGRHLYAARNILFADQPQLDVTTLFALVFVRHAGIGPVATALRAGYVLDPELALPPVMCANGWSDRNEAMFDVGPVGFDRLAGMLEYLGLSCDKDATPQSDPPEFASWTRHPDLSLEVDWHAPADERPYLEIRGTGAGRLASFLEEALGGAARPGPERALTDLLTVPRRAAPASAPAAEARWEMLCVAVVGEGVFDDLPGRALVSAGLADSDWRVRMTALWAVGHHRMSGLAAKAEKTALPKLGYKGLSQDDRRVLLALRDLAAARSAGRSDMIKPGADAGFVARVAALIDAVPDTADTRADALIRALLRQPVAADRVPVAWKRWMAASST